MEAVLWLILFGLVIGALARLALPGPDPMPIWATILLGVAGALIGGTVAIAAGAGAGASYVISVLAATLLLFLYRRLVQKRGITGPDAYRRPGRREERDEEPDPVARLERLRELRDSGLISEKEFELKRREAVDRL